VSITMVGSTRTDASGTAVLQLEYPKSFGSWVESEIRVTASGVVSPPARDVRILPVSAAEIASETVTPSFQFSPYGRSNSCTNPN
jgi:hypothetical protein